MTEMLVLVVVVACHMVEECTDGKQREVEPQTVCVGDQSDY